MSSSEVPDATPANQVAQAPPPYPCPLCKAPHPLARCSIFLALPVRQRCQTAQAHWYCLNCLARSDSIASCTSPDRCRRCGARHHTTLHEGPANVLPRHQQLQRRLQPGAPPARISTRSHAPRHPRRSRGGVQRGATLSQAAGPVMTMPALRAAITGREAFRLLGQFMWLLSRQV